MRRRSYKPLLGLALLAFILVSLPTGIVQRARGRFVAFFNPLWHPLTPSSFDEEKQRLEAENHLLRLELMKYAQATQELKYHTDKLRAVPAHVIYRDPGQWRSLCWVDVGEKRNRELGQKIIEHNSPVLVGKALVGVVEQVYENQSSIRLITDPTLKPSVRAVRGYLQNVVFHEQLKSVLARLEQEAPTPVLNYLHQLEAKLEGPATDWLLAKGVLQGAGVPLWRGRSHLLRGIGFNCDFADAKAPARELRSGESIHDKNAPPMPILCEHDLLVTTGMDGVFPMGLPVAEVTKIYPLREGAYAYEIEASPIVKNLEALQTVCIIPKMEFVNP